jgi:hypothetical protein
MIRRFAVQNFASVGTVLLFVVSTVASQRAPTTSAIYVSMTLSRSPKKRQQITDGIVRLRHYAPFVRLAVIDELIGGCFEAIPLVEFFFQSFRISLKLLAVGNVKHAGAVVYAIRSLPIFFCRSDSASRYVNGLNRPLKAALRATELPRHKSQFVQVWNCRFFAHTDLTVPFFARATIRSYTRWEKSVNHFS